MSATDRESVNQSHAKQESPRTHATQAPLNRSVFKSNTSAGRAPVRQSPPSNRTTT